MKSTLIRANIYPSTCQEFLGLHNILHSKGKLTLESAALHNMTNNSFVI